MAYLGNSLGIGSSAVTASASALSPFTNTYSVDFDGTDDYATTGLINGSNNFDQAFTVSMWIKLDDVSSDQKFFGRYVDPGAIARRFFFGVLGTKLAVGVGGTYNNSIDHGLSTGTWYCLTFTFDGSTFTYYRNGTLVDTITSITWINDSSPHDCYIGAFNNKGTPQGFTNGKIDEVAVLNSELSAVQVTAIYNSGVPADLTSYSPIAHWRMGDNDGGTGTTITDQGSGGNDATLTNGPTFSTDVPVYVFNRYSVDFDGIDDYAIVDNSGGEFSFGNASSDTAFSGSAWIKFDSATNFQILTCADGSSTDLEWQFRVLNGGQLFASLFDANVANSIRCTATSTLSTGTWYHVGFSYDGSGSETGLNLYLNGSPIAATQAEVGTYIAMHAQSTEVRIGSLNYNTDQFANGKIDEPAIFGSELSAEQFLAIYNGGEPASLTSYSPIGWWRFEEGTGTSIADSSGNGHTATLTNGPTFSTDVPT